MSTAKIGCREYEEEQPNSITAFYDVDDDTFFSQQQEWLERK